jgi:hypothetical protein
MAAEYTLITLDQMNSFMNSNFHSLNPVQNTKNGEVVFTLNLDKDVVVNVWSSIHRDKSAKSGSDSIKLTMNSKINDRPLLEKQTSVKRTQGWKKSIMSRVQDITLAYFENPEYFQQRANEAKSSSRLATEKQVNFALRLMAEVSDDDFMDMFSRQKPEREELEGMLSKDVSMLIDGLK